MRPPLPESILRERVIPIARGLNARSALELTAALFDSGLTTIEVTVERPGGFDAIEALRDGGMTVGAGTVLTADQAASAVAAGAQFLVSPHLDRDLVGWVGHNDVPLIPGGLTPTEIAAAWALEVPAVKIFPASIGGPEYVKSLLAPYPDLALIPTGGIDAANAAAFLASGAVAVGVGGWLTAAHTLAIVRERASLLRSRVV